MNTARRASGLPFHKNDPAGTNPAGSFLDSRKVFSTHKLVDGLIQSLEIGRIAVTHAVLQMVLEDHPCGAAEGRTDRCQLHQYFRAVPPVLHHALDGFQMTDSPGQPVDHSFRLGVHMPVGVLMSVLVFSRVGVNMTVTVVMVIDFLVFVHFGHFLSLSE